MQRSQEDAEAMVRALEQVWREQAHLAKAYQAEAAELWRLHAQHERLIAEQRSEIESLRTALAARPEVAPEVLPEVSPEAVPKFTPEAGPASERGARRHPESRGPIRSSRRWLWSAGER